MPTRAKSNVPHQPLRWTLTRASREFKASPTTLNSRLDAAGIKPGADSCYATEDILGAIYGDWHSERLRLIKEQADGHALDNAEKRNELLPADEVFKALEPLFLAIKQEILGSPLGPEEQDSILRHLADFDYLMLQPKGKKPNGAHNPPPAAPVVTPVARKRSSR